MLTLLRVRREARLRRQPELDGASRPLLRPGSLQQPSFFFGKCHLARCPPRSANNVARYSTAAPTHALRTLKLPIREALFAHLRTRRQLLARLRATMPYDKDTGQRVAG
jgi:hypothetical protein